MTNKVTFTAIGRADFNGINGIGAVSVPGMKVGDQTMFYCAAADGSVPGEYFETRISVDDEIQQTATYDLSGTAFTILFFRSV